MARSLMRGPRDGAATVRERPAEQPLPNGGGSELLSESGSQYWRSVARMGTQVAEALDYAGSQGILHRDIKPSNLLLDTRGNVWVTDFGLAKAGAGENLTHTGDVIGTLRDMAPERFVGRSDLRCDIYSLGLKLYELLTLQPAFGEKDRTKLIHQATMEEPSPPRRIDPRIPRDLETIVLKAIARDPAHRYQPGTELATDLQRFVEDRPILPPACPQEPPPTEAIASPTSPRCGTPVAAKSFLRGNDSASVPIRSLLSVRMVPVSPHFARTAPCGSGRPPAAGRFSYENTWAVGLRLSSTIRMAGSSSASSAHSPPRDRRGCGTPAAARNCCPSPVRIGDGGSCNSAPTAGN